jgi:protein-S-isoprenylcysteine O-methyltransferase Ste14
MALIADSSAEVAPLERRASMVGKVVYGALFVVVLPPLLFLWARATRDLVTISVEPQPVFGGVAMVIGFALVISGWIALKIHGGGLPMNAYPPPRFVTRGIYRALRHPIYVGFVMACAGVALVAGSASGVFIVTPAMAMACAALVLGYEAFDLARRFGDGRAPTWSDLAPDALSAPTLAQRLAAHAMVIAPWCLLYTLVTWMGAPRDAFSLSLPFEHELPVIEEAEPVYASAYLVVATAPLVAKTQRALRRFEVHALIAMAVVFPLYLALPIVAKPRPFTPSGVLGELLAWERSIDSPGGAFPSFHVVWAFIAADLYAAAVPRARHLFRGWAVAVAASCVATGMHPLLDVLGGLAAYGLVRRYRTISGWIRFAAEHMANSWREWRSGPVRFIRHGAYAGLAAFLGLTIVSTLLGPGHEPALLITATAGLVAAGAWGQVIEGSPRLMRPFGFWGYLLGVCVSGTIAPLLGTPTWTLLAAYCVAAPVAQSVGRLRCLVQGCCHGSPSSDAIGIRYNHPRSRVTRLSELGGIPVHPTPVYSILWNALIALWVGRLWSLGVDGRFLCGIYLVLMGLGRFVEEAYRGEPQTPVFAQLRLYQWASVGAVIVGAGMTAWHGETPVPAPLPHATALVIATVFALLTAGAMGLDFPESRWRFSRLA